MPDNPVTNDDDEGWHYIHYPPVFTKIKDGVLLSFLGNLDKSDPFQNITQHFHSEINDKQIKNIIKYFTNVQIPWYGSCYKYGDESLPDFHVIQKDLTFNNERNDKTFFSVEKDKFFNEFRICAIRIISPQWKVKKTILALDDKKYHWRKIQHIFLAKELATV